MLRVNRVARVAVIGGGIAGLRVAQLRARAGDEVTLWEASGALGGQLKTERTDGYVVEQGAEGFVASSRAMGALADELGIGSRVIGQLTPESFGFDGSKLVALAPGQAAQFLGFQVPRRDLGKGIRAFSSGMSEVVEAIVRAFPPYVDVRVGEAVERLTRAGSLWRVATRRSDRTLEVDRVVVATGARAASALLESEVGAPARELFQAEALSSVTVSLAYDRGSIAHPLDGTGFVVAESAVVDGLRACTFSSSKLAGRSPPGKALLRAFFRPRDEDIDLDDRAWSARAERGIERVLSPSARPERAWVSRWRAALPVFDAAHEARVAALESALAGSRVTLAGAAFHGSGIDAALRSAEGSAAWSE
jgi:oxygen-dependent protoporphyrinogen oxidase